DNRKIFRNKPLIFLNHHSSVTSYTHFRNLPAPLNILSNFAANIYLMKKTYSRPKAAFHTSRPADRKPGIARNRLIIGRKPILEALESGTDIDKIFILKSATGDDVQVIRQKAKERNIACSLVPVEKLDRMSKSN